MKQKIYILYLECFGHLYSRGIFSSKEKASKKKAEIKSSKLWSEDVDRYNKTFIIVESELED